MSSIPRQLATFAAVLAVLFAGVVGLLPFAALGVLGHLLTADTIGPAAGGIVSLPALVSGNWFPLGEGVMRDVAQALPSYWLVQASQRVARRRRLERDGLARRRRMGLRARAARGGRPEARHRARLTAR